MSRQPVWVGHFSTSVAIQRDYNVKLMGCFYISRISDIIRNILSIFQAAHMAGHSSTSPATEEDLLHIGSHMVKRWLGEISPHHVKVKIFEEKKHLLFLKIIFQGAWRKEGAHSYQHLIQRRNSHSLVTISFFSISGDLHISFQ